VLYFAKNSQYVNLVVHSVFIFTIATECANQTCWKTADLRGSWGVWWMDSEMVGAKIIWDMGRTRIVSTT
jgi:hypothetical protein